MFSVPVGDYLTPAGQDIVVAGGERYHISYRFKIISRHVSKVRVLHSPLLTNAAPAPRRPNYKDFIRGYALDSRTKPPSPKVKPVKTEKLRIGYYRQNTLEPIPGLTSIDWLEYDLQLVANQNVIIPLNDCVFGTLRIIKGNDTNLLSLLNNLALSSNFYRYSDYLESSLPELYGHWLTLWQQATPPQVLPPLPPEYSSPAIIVQDELTTTAEANRAIRSLAANNNCWNNDPTIYSDIGFESAHPMFELNDSRAYQWHIAPQPDDSIGILTMDSPRTIEIHAALEAGKYAVNELDPNVPRVATLGHLIDRTAGLLGYRPKADGMIDQAAEKTTYQRAVLKPGATPPAGDYLAGRFGKRGLLMRRLPNKKTTAGWEAGGYVAIHDIPQLLTEVLDQLNEAMNLQDSTSIQIKDGDKTYTYASQLALLVEMATALIPQKRQIKEIWTSSLVSQQSINEVIAGIGLPTVAKSVTIGGAKLPYWGIQPDKSLQREIATVAYNVGLGNGQIL